MPGRKDCVDENMDVSQSNSKAAAAAPTSDILNLNLVSLVGSHVSRVEPLTDHSGGQMLHG